LSEAKSDINIITSEDYQEFEKLKNVIPNMKSADQMEILKIIIPHLKNSEEYLKELVDVFDNSTANTIESIEVAAKYVKHKRIYQELKKLIENSISEEKDYQNILSKNPWVFGSEYSELLERRVWTRDDKLDYMLRRTVDNYLEIVEIKTPIKESLFIYDQSHDSYHQCAKLSKVIGQVMRYITEIERSRDVILSKDKCDTLKIRATIIIGRDGNEKQQEALHNLNTHLYRIEIVTFDQLLRIAKRVLQIYYDDKSRKMVDEENDKDIPF